MENETQHSSNLRKTVTNNLRETVTKFRIGMGRLSETIRDYPGITFSLFVAGLYAVGIFFYKGMLFAYGLEVYMFPLTFEQTLQSTWNFLFMLGVLAYDLTIWVLVYLLLLVALLITGISVFGKYSWVLVLVIGVYFTLFPLTVGYQLAMNSLEDDGSSSENQSIFCDVATVRLKNDSQEVLKQRIVVASDKYLAVHDNQKLTIYPMSEVKTIEYLRRKKKGKNCPQINASKQTD